MIQTRIESILGSTKRPGENWTDTIKRLQPLGRVDMKTLIDLQAVILDWLDELEKIEKPKEQSIIFSGTTLVDEPDPFDPNVRAKISHKKRKLKSK
jgi:hypothetical protein